MATLFSFAVGIINDVTICRLTISYLVEFRTLLSTTSELLCCFCFFLRKILELYQNRSFLPTAFAIIRDTKSKKNSKENCFFSEQNLLGRTTVIQGVSNLMRQSLILCELRKHKILIKPQAKKTFEFHCF